MYKIEGEKTDRKKQLKMGRVILNSLGQRHDGQDGERNYDKVTGRVRKTGWHY